MMEKSEMRDDVSIFFNFTKTVFEKADPLMGLINVGKPLLFYDRLSVGSFLKSPEEREEYIESLLFDMRNLLESRSLSQKDRNGRIRLIVAIDLSNGICPPSDNQAQKRFPAQNARYFKQKVKQTFAEGTFDEENRLIDRFRYCFIFIDSSSDKQVLPKLYREAAYSGYSKLSDSKWITEDMFSTFVDNAKKKVKEVFADFLPNTSFDDEKASTLLAQIVQKIDEMLKKGDLPFSRFLKEAGVHDEFRDLLRERLRRVKTVDGIKSLSFKDEILSVVSSLLGIGSESFVDSTFFLLRVNNSTDSEKCKGEVYFKSLIQLIATMDDDTYRNNLLASSAIHSPWYFTLDIANAPKPEDGYNEAAFINLYNYTKKCKDKMGDLRWPKDSAVSYIQYKSNTQDPQMNDSYNHLNSELEKERNKKHARFWQVRKIPFFFGKKPGDWRWYDEVMASVEDIYKFEKENDRPLYDVSKRITYSEMDVPKKDSTFAELEADLNKTEAENVEKIKMEDYKGYQEKRHKLMEDFSKAIDELKTQMVKLGFLSRVLWVSILSSVVFTIGFAFHFFYNGFEDKPIWIAAGLGGIAVLFVFGAIIARSIVKSQIVDAYTTIDRIFDGLRNELNNFFKEVNKRVTLQNEADIRKRNLDEMRAKMSEFYSHNKQVEIWEEFYDGIVEKIQKLTQDVDGGEADGDNRNFFDRDFHLSLFPFLPYKVRQEFETMKTKIKDTEINNVTCFVKQFNFTRLPK